MIKPTTIKLIERLANVFELAGLIVVLLLALLFQFILHELPCPLCLLQRVGFLCIAFGFLLNLRFGFKPSHYSIVIISGIYTSFVALRQIALHVIPGTGAYGNPFLGLHLYTWSFVIAMAIVIVTTLLFGIDRQYNPPNKASYFWRFLTNLMFAIVSLIIVINIITVIFECGFVAECPDNPVGYKLVDNGKL